MDSPLKQRLIGAAVLAALAIIFLPMLLKGPDVKEPDAATVPLSMPATPGEEFETRELPLTAPEAAPAGGVLGMASGSAARPSPAAAAIPVPDGDQAALADAGPADTAAVAAAPAPAATTPPTTATVPPPAAKPATPMPATVGAGAYMVNIGSFGNLANANALIAKLRAANLPVRADRVALAAGSATRIRVGPYGDRAAAEAARLRADSVTAASSKVIVLDAQAEAPAKQASPAPAPLPKPVAPVVAAPTPAAASKPVATASEPARPANVSAGFAVQLSAPSVEAEANALRDRARGQGFNSFVQRIETASGVRYRVRVGPVADRSAAASLRDAVNGKLGTKGIIVGNP